MQSNLVITDDSECLKSKFGSNSGYIRVKSVKANRKSVILNKPY